MEKDKELRTIIDYGLASENENKIIKFLDKIYKTSIDNPEIWEKEIFSFFSKELIIPYFIVTSLDEDTDFIIEAIKKQYFEKLKGGVIIWNSDECYKDLIQIKESLGTGMKLKEFLPFLFLQNNLLRQMFMKRYDKEDTRFKNFGHSIQPVSREVTSSKGIFFESIFFISPDAEAIFPYKTWSKEIFEKWRIELKRKLNMGNHNKTKRRDPIESRLRHEVFKRDGYKCKECGKTNKETTLHVDHILPIAQNGTDELDNLQTLCQACNLAKSNRKWIGGNNDR